LKNLGAPNDFAAGQAALSSGGYCRSGAPATRALRGNDHNPAYQSRGGWSAAASHFKGDFS
jgi:hypothetical protein